VKIPRCCAYHDNADTTIVNATKGQSIIGEIGGDIVDATAAKGTLPNNTLRQLPVASEN